MHETPDGIARMDALNKCDWNRIMAQYPADDQLNLPDGMVAKGREAAGKLFRRLCQTRWFTEGFDTRDLKEAKALLGQLAL